MIFTRLIHCFLALIVCLPLALPGQTVTIVRANVDIDLDGSITKYKYGDGEGDPLDAAALGDITSASELKMTSLNVLTTESGGCTATAARIYYRIYPQGGPVSAYQTVQFTDICSCAGDPDCWPTPQSSGCVPTGRSFQDLSVEIDLKAAALAVGGGVGTYVLDVYWEVDAIGAGCGTTATAPSLATYTVSTPLPAELISFNAYKTGSAVTLKWATASEQNSHYFEVERSGDLFAWEVVGRLNSRGAQAAAWQTYSLRDEKPLPSLNYYRLLQVDKDGSRQYSSVVAVLMGQQGNLQIAPNPVGNGLTWLSLRDWPNTPLHLRLFDTYGRLLREWQPDVEQDTRIPIDISAFPNGFLWLQANDTTPVKIIKQ
ncbi:MAG: hypothetical protein LH618_02595 [Saprospiraceae bacterium]|nr:hypothetical protein [Saprospiraceae bacterium]